MAAEAPVDTNMADISETAGDAQAAIGKRKAETELERAAKKPSPSIDGQEPVADEANTSHDADAADATEKPPMSKNQLKRLRRQQQWEEFKEDRKSKRKDKRHERQARKRAAKEAIIAEAEAAGIDPAIALRPKEPWKYRPVPVSFIIDCDFEQYMRDSEIVSLSSQIVRSYAMNRKSKYQASLHISSWKGKLKTRFETVLRGAHENWKNVGIHEGDFLEAAKRAQEQMTGPNGGEIVDLIKPREGEQGLTADAGDGNPTVVAEPEGEVVDRSVVYLSSESPYTLERLEANTSYVIGGIVDRNREKGLCYGRAKEHKVRTAKLPIGEFMAMQSRYVLTTNQVVEIMAKWLECGDWGKAFMDVIPKRKGGTLKGEGGEGGSTQDGEEEEDDGETGDVALGVETPSQDDNINPSAKESAAPQQDVPQ